MTWILGSGVPFGYGALISDVRASFPDGRYIDGVQKIHPIGNGLIAGFAGSIAVGFCAIDRFRQGWCAPPGAFYPVQRAAWGFGHHWRRFYPRFKTEFRDLGCELIVAGISSVATAQWPLSCAAILRAPKFEPQFIRGFRWGSIGSGSQHKTAAEYANTDNNWNHLQSEVANPGGIVWSTALSVAAGLDADPMSDVSSKLQIGVTRADRHEIGVLRREVKGAWTIAGRGEPAPGEFFTTWEDFENAVGRADALGAVG